MSAAHLALATAAALLVCARADTQEEKHLPKRFSDFRQEKTFNKQREKRIEHSYINNRKNLFNGRNDSGALRLFPNNAQPDEAFIKDTQKYNKTQKIHSSNRSNKSYTSTKKTLSSACLYEGRWHNDGAVVSTREDCLRCVCARGALSCQRRACAPLPNPLPKRCHVRHRRHVCCPELHCPDGVQLMEHEALARFERLDAVTEAETPTATPAAPSNACVEGGSVFAAGSALGSRMACEQCFCLRGARHCVRPSCLAPPLHCAPRPAPGACCPQRYYCDTSTDKPNQHRNRYDCLVEGTLVSEGSPVATRGNCSSCFCLRGEVRCQAMGCAPALAGCRPVMAVGDCCANQYVCDHDEREPPSHVTMAQESSPISMRYDERTFHSSKSSKLESTTKNIITSLYTMKHTSFASSTKNHLTSTTKVKRKTDEPPISSRQKLELNANTTSTNITQTQEPLSFAKLIAMPELSQEIDIDAYSEESSAEQPEGTVKIMINGTINCTAELSSTSLPLSITLNNTDQIQKEAMPRVPIVNVEAQTYSPNDIITDRNVNGGFDEEDTFTINVTSSLMTNTSHSTTSTPPVATGSKIPIPAELAEVLNSSNNKKGEYDYDYTDTEPTLPPSLPNLKIIPFVAADAVVDDDLNKDTITYPMLDKEDKYPVYYPTVDTKDATFPSRQADTYQPTQYPVFTLDKVEPSYPTISYEVDLTRDSFPERNELGVHEYTVSTPLGSHGSELKAVTIPTTSITYAMETPAVNHFSPPIKTEGGFIPKGSGVIDEFYAVFSSTTPSSTVPHLTTSMQLNVLKGECMAEDGRRVPGGQSVVIGCQLCTCTWVELSCEHVPCTVAPGCRRLPHSNHSRDPCCGDLDCTADNNTTLGSNAAKNQNENKRNETKVSSKTSESSAVGVINKTNKDKSNGEKMAVNNLTTLPTGNSESVQATSTSVVPTKPTPNVTRSTTTSAKVTRTTTPASRKQIEDNSQEDEDEDEEFSFGSVLKLLLSDNFETTTAPNRKLISRPPFAPPLAVQPVRNPSEGEPPTSRPKTEPPTNRTKIEPPTSRPKTEPPTSRPITEPPTSRPKTEPMFKPLPPLKFNYPPLPARMSPNNYNRIDHLVLGEATAIKRIPPSNKTTQRPIPQTYDSPERRPGIQEEAVQSLSVSAEGPRPPSLGGLPVGPGLLKLAGCNIYGRMYRVGRIITELSTPCQECWCTEIGVQCKPLAC